MKSLAIVLLLVTPSVAAWGAEVTPLMMERSEFLTPEQLQQRRRDTERFYSGGAQLHAGNPFSGKFTIRVLPDQNGRVE